jgi:hypothetical protein
MDVITELNISLNEIDERQKIDETREWRPILDELNEDEYDNAVFIGFRAGDSPPLAGEVEYEAERAFTETLWVYKSEYTIRDLMEGEVTPQELMQEVEEEQPNIEVVGLAKYVRNIST